MKILMSNYEFPPIGGGAGRANLNLLRQFADNGQLTVDLVTSAPEPGFSIEEFSSNITIYKIGVHKKNLHYWRKTEVLEWLFKASSEYRKLVGKNDYDAAHAFFAFPTGWLPYRHAAKMPYVISLRGSDVPGYNVRLGVDYKLLAPLFSRIWKSASSIVANSSGLANLANQFAPDLPVGVICNGIDTEQFKPNPDKKNGMPVRLLTVCRLISRKRIGLLIEAVKLLKDRNIDVQLNIAGEGNLLCELKKLAGDMSVTDKVNFMGLVAAVDLPGLYRGNDIFVMSSAHEGMSNAMLEAMASGLPIVTTRCEGVEELIADNGIVVDGFEPELIAQSVQRLIEAPREREQMAVAARRRALTFSWQNVANQYLDCYRRLL